jgi:hypothetical protein
MLAQKLPFGIISPKESRLNLHQSNSSLVPKDFSAAKLDKRRSSALSQTLNKLETIDSQVNRQSSKLEMAPRNFSLFSPKESDMLNRIESVQLFDGSAIKSKPKFTSLVKVAKPARLHGSN